MCGFSYDFEKGYQEQDVDEDRFRVYWVLDIKDKKQKGDMKNKITRHQALYNLLTDKLGYKEDVDIESGFEGDFLWVNEEAQWVAWQDEGFDVEDREFMENHYGVDRETTIYKQDGWLIWGIFET